MPLSWEDISNMAAARIGVSSRVTSLENNDKLSIACNTAIFSCRDATLQDWDWKCASTRVQLTKDPVPPAFGFKNRYLLPTVPYCLVVREMRPHFYNYVIEGRYLLTDADSDHENVFIRYTASIDDLSSIDVLCLKAIAYRMAAEICNLFVQGNAATGQAAIMKEYLMILEEAEGANQWNDKNHDEDAPRSFNDPLFRGHGNERSLELGEGDDWVSGGQWTATY
jgi:hypothetical protein